MNKILEVKSLYLKNNKNDKKILENISINVEKGKIVSIIGESGSGKTLFIKSILKKLPENINNEKGEIKFLNENITKELVIKHIGLITQNPLEALNPSMKIYKQLEEAINGKIDNQVRVLLEKVGILDIDEVLNSYPYKLSGGMCQRIMIAMMMLKKPDLLIADEPTTSLDMINQTLIIRELIKLQKELNMSILLITHDLSLVMEISDYVYILKEGKIIEEGNTKEIYDNPKDEYTKKFLNLINLKRIDEEEKNEGKEILKIEKLYKDYNKKNILNGISFNLKENEIVSIIGESGSGKSTLARIISGLENSKSGDEYYFNIKRFKNMFKNKNYRQNIQMVFQNSFISVDPQYTIYRILEEPLNNFFNLNLLEKKSHIEKILKSVELNDVDINQKGIHLSGGQLQRVCLARALLAKPKILILDEFTSSLDLIIRNKILDLVKKLKDEYKFSIIFITHDLESVLRVSDRFYVMKGGEIIDEVLKMDTKLLKNKYTKFLFESIMTGNPHNKKVLY
ncbi:ABC transporter ATP-binding protein [Oceanivirga salmonicida]|uniref:ABC transporter ATP-binding protein n=1 Tax=Oceanivirga salmonicida TaxID=1769291 RepID=UPI000831DC86|nr:ABC transporter ATP-binding protein [Oceanivirga salmonicida]